MRIKSLGQKLSVFYNISIMIIGYDPVYNPNELRQCLKIYFKNITVVLAFQKFRFDVIGQT